MTDRPILFSGPMVRALIAGTKTQTRRTLKGAPAEATSAGTTYSSETGHSNVWTWLSGDPMDIDTWGVLDDFRLPYKVGDRLYVREHWRAHSTFDAVAPRDMPQSRVFYIADQAYEPKSRFRQGMHMPRWASRITLTVTDVRVERLQDISEADAVAEGIELVRETERWGKHWRNYGADGFDDRSAVYSYRTLWNAVNGHTGASPKPAEPWSLNPWVAAYTFTVAMGNIDQLEVA